MLIEKQEGSGNLVKQADVLGDKMALMIDPCCVYDTFGDALRVGRACDEIIIQ